MTSPLRVHGHEATVQALETALRNQRLHHAYLFTGPANVGKLTLALQLAAAVNCAEDDDACRRRVEEGQHPDVRIIAVDSEAEEGPRTIIGIEAIRDIISAAYLQAYEGRMRVFIIDGADHMSAEASNALLKVLEEPPPGVLLLLLSESVDGVLPTVRSRCQLMELRPMPVHQVVTLLRDAYGVEATQAEVIGRLSRGCMGWALQAIRDAAVLASVHQSIERMVGLIDGGLEARFNYAAELARRFQRDRASAREELFLWLRWVRDLLLIQQGYPDGIVNMNWRETLSRQAAALTPTATVRWAHRLTETIEALDRNANPRLALEALMLDTPELRTTV